MKADEFVEILSAAKPSVDELSEYGLDDDEIDEIRATFTAKLRDNEVLALTEGDELIDLITLYDCSSIEVGLVRFSGEITDHPRGAVIGHCEADKIVIQTGGGIALYEHNNAETPTLECAANSDKFLSGLAEFVKIGMSRDEWKGQAEEASSICARAAGGVAYERFFNMLCGFLE